MRKLFSRFCVRERASSAESACNRRRKDTASEQPPKAENRQRKAGWRRYGLLEGFCFCKNRIPGGTAEL